MVKTSTIISSTEILATEFILVLNDNCDYKEQLLRVKRVGEG